jgi:hypothetical protein
MSEMSGIRVIKRAERDALQKNKEAGPGTAFVNSSSEASRRDVAGIIEKWIVEFRQTKSAGVLAAQAFKNSLTKAA